jgi:uncharacterized protein (TIGR04255 family)
MAEQPYKRPPITEAVIGLRFADPIDWATLDKIASALKPFYPREDILKGVQFQMRLDATSPTPSPLNKSNIG